MEGSFGRPNMETDSVVSEVCNLIEGNDDSQFTLKSFKIL